MQAAQCLGTAYIKLQLDAAESELPYSEALLSDICRKLLNHAPGMNESSSCFIIGGAKALSRLSFEELPLEPCLKISAPTEQEREQRKSNGKGIWILFLI